MNLAKSRLISQRKIMGIATANIVMGFQSGVIIPGKMFGYKLSG